MPAAAAGTSSAYPPDGERAPLAAGLPNQNPARGALAAGDRANENNCKTVGGAYATCPAPITPGAVELYFPSGGCLSIGNGADLHIFSGYQYNWVSVIEPPSNTCTNSLGAMSNSAYIGLVYSPSASIRVTSPYAFEAATGGLIAASITAMVFDTEMREIRSASFMSASRVSGSRQSTHSVNGAECRSSDRYSASPLTRKLLSK